MYCIFELFKYYSVSSNSNHAFYNWLYIFLSVLTILLHFIGRLKYLLLAPVLLKSIYDFVTMDANQRDANQLLIIPFLLTRMLNNQIWISLSRDMTAKGKNRIVDKTIEFEQVDRERNWCVSLVLFKIYTST